MNDNSFISAMFEEIKKKVSVIEKKLEQQNISPAKAESPAETEKKDKTITTSDLLVLMQKIIIHCTQREFQQILPQLKDSNKELLERISDLQSNFQKEESHPKIWKKDTLINNLKLWKISSIIIVASLLFCVIIVKIENSKLTDNDLKFRYINSIHSIDSNGLQNIETIFHTNRDEELINNIRKNVEKYESKAKKELFLKTNWYY
jgi:hypothetical protein